MKRDRLLRFLRPAGLAAAAIGMTGMVLGVVGGCRPAEKAAPAGGRGVGEAAAEGSSLSS